MALEQVSAVTRSKYLNTAAGYDIQYDITQDEGQNAQVVTGTVKKADVRFGYVSVSADNSKTISFSKEVLDEDSKVIYDTILSDASEIFKQRNKV